MFSLRLRELRKEKKLTAKQLGEKFNLAESTISGYETGARTPDMNQIEKFADFFDVTVDYLLGRTDDPSPINSSDSGRAYRDGGKGWTDEEIQAADEFIQMLRRRDAEKQKDK